MDSVNSSGAEASYASGYPFISGNSRFVVFSSALLLAGLDPISSCEVGRLDDDGRQPQPRRSPAFPEREGGRATSLLRWQGRDTQNLTRLPPLYLQRPCAQLPMQTSLVSMLKAEYPLFQTL